MPSLAIIFDNRALNGITKICLNPKNHLIVLPLTHPLVEEEQVRINDNTLSIHYGIKPHNVSCVCILL